MHSERVVSFYREVAVGSQESDAEPQEEHGKCRRTNKLRETRPCTMGEWSGEISMICGDGLWKTRSAGASKISGLSAGG